MTGGAIGDAGVSVEGITVGTAAVSVGGRVAEGVKISVSVNMTGVKDT